MAKDKKKKWKSRIKKALKLAAFGGAGYLAAKAFGGRKRLRATDSPGDEFAKARAAMTDLPDYNPPKKDRITKKDVLPDVVPRIKPVIKPTLPLNKIDHGMAYQSSRAAGNYPGVAGSPAPKRVNNVLVKGRINANDPRGTIPFHPSQGNVRPTLETILRQKNTRGWGGKKGGRVTGIAKRGFGRALRKGKK